MINLLKSGDINNRLLCEILTHKNFKKLMADSEILIDGIATMRFNDLNKSLESVRASIMSNNNIENDHIIRTLVAFQIDEEDFF